MKRRVPRARGWPAVACVASILIAAGCGGAREGASDAQLRAVVDETTHGVSTGAAPASERQRYHVPGTALTVIPAGEALRTYTSGVADIATDEPRLADQVQPVGGNTEVMTATIVMQLVEDGRIGLNATLAEVPSRNRAEAGRLSRLVSGLGANVRHVTLRELLNHTSGIADYVDAPEFGRAFARDPLRRWRLAELARFGLAEKPEFAPGTPGRWNYSGTDYILLGLVVEAVTGESFRARMEALFDEARMRDSYYAPSPGALGRPPLSRTIVQGYMPIPARREQLSSPVAAFDRASASDVVGHHRLRYQNVTSAYSLSIAASAGGVVTSTEDLARFWLELFAGRLVREQTLDEMKRTVPTGENAPAVATRWGLGFGEQALEPNALYPGSLPGRVWMRLGNIFGYSSAAYYVENQALAVANVVNLVPQPAGDLGVLPNVLRAWQVPGG